MVGGLVGYAAAGTISSSYSTGSVSGSSYVGGLTGYNISTITKAFWDTETSGMTIGIGGGTTTGATGLTTEAMRQEASFADFDFTDIWNITEGGSFPFLQDNAQEPLPGYLIPQAITFEALAEKAFGDESFALTATGGASGETVTYAISNDTVATISGTTVTIIGVGEATITASQAGNADYQAAVDVPQTLIVNKAAQTITFDALANKTFGDADFELTATGGASDEAVAYASSNEAVASISGSTVTIIGIGETTITASQAGNVNYEAAADVSQTLTVSKAAQTITFDVLADKTFGDEAFELTATGGASGETVTYASSDESVATISGTRVTILAAGETTITASQVGDENYEPAADESQTLTVNKAAQTITFNALEDKTFYDEAFALTATGGASGEAITYSSSDETVATVLGDTVTIIAAGETTITASQAGNGNYEAAPDAAQTLTVTGTSLVDGTGTAADPYQISTAEQLNEIRANLTAHYKLTADIDLTTATGNEAGAYWNDGLGWEPVGSSDDRFTGSLDGNAFKITGLTINRPEQDYVGLFAYLNGSVKNLGIEGVNIHGARFVAALASSNSDTVSSVFVSGEVIGSYVVGGLIGYNNGGLINSSYALSSVSVDSTFAGGLAAYNGGLIIESYSTGSVSGLTAIGGLIGGRNGSGTVSSSYWNTETSGQNNSAGGVGLSSTEMQESIPFNAWDFESVWNIGNNRNNGYPYLKWQYPSDPSPEIVAPFDGSGTSEDPYLITNANELDLMRYYLSAHFKLTANIDLSTATGDASGTYWNDGAGWVPLEAFSGSFDGDGFIIKGVTINRPNASYVGLFGSLSGQITDLGMDSVDLQGSSYIGGLVGYTNGGTISNSYVTGNLTASSSRVGGITGENFGGTITNCYARVSVTGAATFGGLVGYNRGAGSIIENSYVSASVTNTSDAADVGNFTGFNNGTITDSFWDIEASELEKGMGGGTTVGATGLSGTQMKELLPFNAWDFEAVWNIGNDRNDGYPYLKWQHPNDEAPTATIPFENGSGTTEDPYQIANAVDLDNMRYFLSAHFVLTADIDLTMATGDETGEYWNDGAGWIPGGTLSGSLDGDGFIIKGMTINRPNMSYVGLFGSLSGQITDLGMDSLDLKGVQYIGGLVGYTDGGTISNSHVTGSLAGTSSRVGGITGENFGGTITNCYATGSVTGASTFGGLVGYNRGDGSTIENSYTTASVTNPSNASDAGNLTGFNNGTISNSFWNTDTSDLEKGIGGGTAVGATGLTSAEMQEWIQFNAWDFEAIWNIGNDRNEGYPYLKWEHPDDPAPEITSPFDGGSGTEEDPYLVANSTQLDQTRYYFSSHFLLTAAIDLTTATGDEAGDYWNDGKGWEPIGGQSVPFTGSLDGDGFIITGMTINRPEEDNIGLFGSLNGHVSDLGMEAVDITAGANSAGLAGRKNGGTIHGSYVSGSVTATTYTGGLVGYNAAGHITNSYSKGTVTGTSFVGGLIGVNIDTATNSYSTATVSGSSRLGGLAGYNSGLVASSFWNADASELEQGIGGGTTTGTMGLGNYHMQNWALFSTWNFDSIWNIGNDRNEGYPYLQWQYPGDATADTVIFDGGTGTVEDPYQIANANQLDLTRFYLDQHFKLIADIDLSTSTGDEEGMYWNGGAGWQPIGSSLDPFSGSIDGDRHVISGMMINSPGQDYIGLLGALSGEIKNLGMNTVTVNGNSYVGGLAGYNNGGSISSGHVSGSVSGTSTRVGGLTGESYDGTITNCFVSGSISGSSSAGGLVGFNSSQGASIEGSYTTASVSGTADVVDIGGMIGVNNGTITNSYSTGSVSAASGAIGGLAGYNGGTITGSFWNTSISEKEEGIAEGNLEGTTGLTSEEMRQQSSFTDWDFESVWNITNGGSFPFLRDNLQEPVPGLLDQEITFPALTDVVYGADDIALDATSSYDLPVTYESSNPEIAVIVNNKIQIVGAGTVTITAVQPGNDFYNPATPVEQTLTINKATQAITFDVLEDKTYGEVFDLTATTESGEAVTYTSSDEAIATISGSTLTTTGVGDVTITASQAGNANYLAADDVTQTLTVGKAAQSITFEAIDSKTFGDAAFDLAATGGASEEPVTYTSSDEAVATISGSMVTIIGAGEATITASQAGNANYLAADDVTQTLTVGKATQSITFDALENSMYGDAAFDLTATGGASGEAVTYTSSDELVATISGSTVTIIGIGETTITASQAGNANYLPADDVAQTLTVGKAAQSITFEAIDSKTFGDAAFDLAATGGASGEAVTYTSSDELVATISGSTVTIIGIGETTITASQAGNANYEAAADVTQILTVGKAAQSITFEAIDSKTFGDAAFDLAATGGASDEPVTYTSSDESVATISSSTVTIIGVGETTVTASQAGNANYEAGADVTQTLTVGKAAQSITFEAIDSKTFGDAAFDLSATGGASGEAVTYTSSDESVATISGSTVTIIGAGEATITATQAGSANYEAAEDVVQTLIVTKATATVSFGDLEQKADGSAKSPTITTDPEGLSYTVSFNGNVEVPSAPGSYEVLVTIDEPNYEGSGTATFVLDGAVLALDNQHEIKVYPNPASDYLTVGTALKQELLVYDLNGRVMLTGASNRTIDITSLGEGTYLISVGTQMLRFIKK